MMNILMFTNTYLPHVGGVACSIHRFAQELKKRGNSVRVVAPYFTCMPSAEADVIRVPAIRNFNGSGFSIPLPGMRKSAWEIDGFSPDIIHSHHPFLLGNTALRYAALYQVPIVFTHHTLYERYTHYIPGDSLLMRRFVVNLTTSYCNLCDAVVAPSTSVASMLHHRGVRSPVTVIPTGIDPKIFSRKNRTAFRKTVGIPDNAFVIGHVGRLAFEKNLEFLTLALSHYLQANPDDHVLIAGVGPLEDYMRKIFLRHGIMKRLHMIGILGEEELPAAYSAMDVFAFTSQSETQGLVLAEAMACGVPVVALDGPGVRDVVRDGINSRLIMKTDIGEFMSGLLWVKSLGLRGPGQLSGAAEETASRFSMEKSTDSILSLYESLIGMRGASRLRSNSSLKAARMQGRIMESSLLASVHSVVPIARELYSCSSDIPTDTELQTLLAHHSGIRARIAGYAISLYIRIQKISWRKQEEGIEIIRYHLRQGEPVLLSFWHGKYLPMFALLEGLHGCIFASCSFRGEVVAKVCRRFGYECILIPENARQRAVEIMAKAILHYRAGAVAADGPRGPRRVFKLGAVQLSSELGMTVIPASVAVHPKIVARRRWDRYEAPLPFSHVFLKVGKATTVPVGLRPDELSIWSMRLKKSLDDVDSEAEQSLRHALRGNEERLEIPVQRDLKIVSGGDHGKKLL